MPQSFADYDSQYLSSSSQRKGFNSLPISKASRQSGRRPNPTSPTPMCLSLNTDMTKPQQKHLRQESSSSAATSTATSRSSTSTSVASHPSHGPISIREASLKAQDIRPSADVAEWAHQAHMTQRRTYWWCQGCFPREVVEPLHVPKAVEKDITERRVRISEPSHCYDI